jgi:hypothetical protein
VENPEYRRVLFTSLMAQSSYVNQKIRMKVRKGYLLEQIEDVKGRLHDETNCDPL